jgi:hypothetical protein
MKWKDVESSDRGLIWTTIPEFTWRDSERTREASVRIVGGPAKVRNRRLPNISKTCYCSSQLGRWNQLAVNKNDWNNLIVKQNNTVTCQPFVGLRIGVSRQRPVKVPRRRGDVTQQRWNTAPARRRDDVTLGKGVSHVFTWLPGDEPLFCQTTRGVGDVT